MAGENGPELIHSNAGAHVFNAADTKQMMSNGGSPVNYVNHINIALAPGMDRRTGIQIADEVDRKLRIAASRNR